MSCCNDSGPKKAKEWGTVDKKPNSMNKKYIILLCLIAVAIIGFIVLR